MSKQPPVRNAKSPKQPYPETMANFLAGMPKPLPKLQVKPVTTQKLNPLPPVKPKPLPVLVFKPVPVLVPIRPVRALAPIRPVRALAPIWPMRALAPIRPKPPITPTPISVAAIANTSSITPCSKSIAIRNLKPVAGPAQLKVTDEKKAPRAIVHHIGRNTPRELEIVNRVAEVQRRGPTSGDL